MRLLVAHLEGFLAGETDSFRRVFFQVSTTERPFAPDAVPIGTAFDSRQGFPQLSEPVVAFVRKDDVDLPV
jgi:hypothetical protein